MVFSQPPARTVDLHVYPGTDHCPRGVDPGRFVQRNTCGCFEWHVSGTAWQRKAISKHTSTHHRFSDNIEDTVLLKPRRAGQEVLLLSKYILSVHTDRDTEMQATRTNGSTEILSSITTQVHVVNKLPIRRE